MSTSHKAILPGGGSNTLEGSKGACAGDIAAAYPGSSARHERLQLRPVAQLHAHPMLIRHGIVASVCKMEALLKGPAFSFQTPLLVTSDGTIMDGYARWELARRQASQELPCLVLDVMQEEALEYVLCNQLRREGLNDYVRIELALELEPWLREKALENQRTGGHQKAATNLAEAQRVNVRRSVARIARASVGNVGKVKFIRSHAILEIKDALREGKIRIHRAYLWASDPPDKQRKALIDHESEQMVSGIVREVVRRHRRHSGPDIDSVGIARALATEIIAAPGDIPVSVLRTPGRAVYITFELACSLSGKKDSNPCDPTL